MVVGSDVVAVVVVDDLVGLHVHRLADGSLQGGPDPGGGDRLGVQPGVPPDGGHADALAGRDGETLLNQVFDVGTESEVRPEADLGALDLVVGLEGDVTAHHVVEQDAQAPDGQVVRLVPPELDPLGRGVDPGPVEVRVDDVVVVPGAGAEVDQLDGVALGVDEDVLVLDITMEDPGGVNLLQGGHQLPEDLPGDLLLERSGVADEVEQVLDIVGTGTGSGCHTLQDEHVAVGQLVVLQEPDHAADVGHHLHQGDLDRDPDPAGVLGLHGPGLVDHLDGDRLSIAVPISSIDCPEAALAKKAACRVQPIEVGLGYDI